MTEIDGSVPRGQADGGFLSVRTIDGWLEVDAAAEARPGLARALGIDGIAAPEDPAADLAQVQEAIEQVTARWHAARQEERRVGKASVSTWRSRWAADSYKK